MTEPQKNPYFMRVENTATPMLRTSGVLGRVSGTGLGFESSVYLLETIEGLFSMGSLRSMVSAPPPCSYITPASHLQLPYFLGLPLYAILS